MYSTLGYSMCVHYICNTVLACCFTVEKETEVSFGLLNVAQIMPKNVPFMGSPIHFGTEQL